ncbi:MAG: hypothetical protein AB7R69_00975 [Candidatus Babeliales bacterium]
MNKNVIKIAVCIVLFLGWQPASSEQDLSWQNYKNNLSALAKQGLEHAEKQNPSCSPEKHEAPKKDGFFRTIIQTIKSDLGLSEFNNGSPCFYKDEKGVFHFHDNVDQFSFKKNLYAGLRVTLYGIIQNVIISKVYYLLFTPKSFPQEKVPWVGAILVAPIFEELLYTYSPSTIMPRLSNYLMPILFASVHSCYPLPLSIGSGVRNFLRHRTLRSTTNLSLVPVISHMAHNTIVPLLFH